MPYLLPIGMQVWNNFADKTLDNTLKIYSKRHIFSNNHWIRQYYAKNKPGKNILCYFYGYRDSILWISYFCSFGWYKQSYGNVWKNYRTSSQSKTSEVYCTVVLFYTRDDLYYYPPFIAIYESWRYFWYFYCPLPVNFNPTHQHTVSITIPVLVDI